MAYTIPGITSNAREIIRWAFDEETEKGNVSNVFHLDDIFVVATLKSIYPEGNMDLEQVRTFVETMVKRDKKAEKLSSLLTASMAKSKNLQTIASQYKSTVDTVMVTFNDRNFGHYGPEPGLIGKIFAQKPQSGIQLMKGDMGMYVINVVDVKIPSSLQMDDNQSKNTEMQQQQQSMMYQNKVQNSSMPALKKVYKIVDNRYKVF
jgi:peptidyl-prolyl cis-trans isomerase D